MMMSETHFGTASKEIALSSNSIARVWDAATEFDPSVKIRTNQAAAVAAKRVIPEHYSRSRLFERMSENLPSLFVDFPLGGSSTKNDPGVRIDEAICSGFPRQKRARVRTAGRIEYLPVPDVISRWSRGASTFGVTDLHYIGTSFDKTVDTQGLNDFNLLPRGTDGFQSQDSLVISSAGAVTDSHSDDHSGSNHSFYGTKLWLLWDTVEGFELGLQDVSHADVYDRAMFDMSAFLKLKTSQWILIGPGQTMFIPANLTHKVIGLESYLGLGSFHAGLPGFVDLLMRWAELSPQWCRGNPEKSRCSVRFLTERAIRKLNDLKHATLQDRFRWGVPHLRRRLSKLGSQRRQLDSAIQSPNAKYLERFVRAASAAFST